MTLVANKPKYENLTNADCSIDVHGSGVVILGPDVTCDGFQKDHGVRVQSHIHKDHMRAFGTSLKNCTVLMTGATGDLLSDEWPQLRCTHHAKFGGSFEVNGNKIDLVSSNHMLGAAQTKVTLSDGTTLGYSGDFAWPIDEVIQVDQLVVDATYGCPDSSRHLDQGEVQSAFCQITTDGLRTHGCVHIKSDSGPLHRGLEALCVDEVITDQIPVLCSSNTMQHIDVYRQHGYSMPNLVLQSDCDEARAVKRNGNYLQLWQASDSFQNDILAGITIHLTKFGSRNNDETEPYAVTNENNYTVRLSNHADYDGTMAYIEKTGASIVVTDAHRNERYAEILARQINAQIEGVDARTSTNFKTHAWGG